MARERDHAAEYARRRELAQERGFRTPYEERHYRAEVKQEGREGAAALALTGGRRTSDPGAIAAFVREYSPGSMKLDALKERIRDLLSTTPAYDIPTLPEGADYEEYMEFYGGSDEDVFGEGSDAALIAEHFGGMPFDEWDDSEWDDFFESDAWYDFLDELYADK
jgi:hypothetical protein